MLRRGRSSACESFEGSNLLRRQYADRPYFLPLARDRRRRRSGGSTGTGSSSTAPHSMDLERLRALVTAHRDFPRPGIVFRCAATAATASATGRGADAATPRAAAGT